MTTTVSDAIELRAPVARAYEAWRDRNEFRRIVERMREAWRLQEARYHWQDKETAEPVEWDDAPGITDDIPNQFLAWQDNERANQTATAEFSPVSDRASRVTVELTFEPVSSLEPDRTDANAAIYTQLRKELEDFKSVVEHPEES